MATKTVRVLHLSMSIYPVSAYEFTHNALPLFPGMSMFSLLSTKCHLQNYLLLTAHHLITLLEQGYPLSYSATGCPRHTELIPPVLNLLRCCTLPIT